jgi:hypothetical protein
MSKAPLLFQFGSLTGSYVTDLINIEFYITPKNHFIKVTFRGSNCS